ncbi:MAG TPA: DHA2 family efflux MFS transporter permease subunit [Streptosporangiaceae bacterium]
MSTTGHVSTSRGPTTGSPVSGGVGQVFSAPRQRWVLGLTSMASLMVGLDALVVTTALSTIQLHLAASIEQLEWIINAYALSFAVLLMTATALGDRFGRRLLFIAGLGLFTASSAACALAPGIDALIAARALQGAGSAMIMPHAMALLSAAFPPQRRARALGIFSGVTGLAVLGGPMVGGAVVQGLAWQWIFWLNVPIGLLVIPLVLSQIEETPRIGASIDFAGLILVTGAALGLVYGLVRGNAAGWASMQVAGSLVAGILLAAGFVAWELRARAPMLPMRFFRSRAFSAGNAAAFLLSASLFGAVFFFAQFLQVALRYGPIATGIRMAPWTVALSLVAPAAGALAGRIGERPLVVTGLALQAAGFSWIALLATPTLAYPALIAPLLIAGAGVSMAMPATQNSVIGAVPASGIGKASGTFNTLRQLGAAFGIAIAAAVFTQSGSYTSAHAFSAGFAPAVGMAAALSLMAAIAGAWIPRRGQAGVAKVPGRQTGAGDNGTDNSPGRRDPAASQYGDGSRLAAGMLRAD